MTTLTLAEKPSQARDIAKILGIKRAHDGYIELNNGDFVVWVIGHVLELLMPQDYDPAWAKWAWEHLPMIPPVWKHKVDKSPGKAKQFAAIKTLLKKVDRVVIATDAEREGELIAREVLEHCKYKGKIERLWTSSLVEADLRKALSNLLPGSATEALYEAAVARTHCDWTWGLSGTRAVTLGANVSGVTFPVGRVKTPTLAMFVRRNRDILKFDSKGYFEIEAKVTTVKGVVFKMLHSPAVEQRITSRDIALELVAKAKGHQGPLSVAKTNEVEQPPLPYSLPILQMEANKVFKFSARKTLKIAQQLYEKKATTYPRTDCRYLANSQVAEIPGVLEALHRRFPDAVASLHKKGVVTRASTFDDNKLVGHHALIPTSLPTDLDSDELLLFSLIAQQYLRTLAPECKFISTKVKLNANGVLFTTSGRTVTDIGWKSIKLVSVKGDGADE